jgi:hypothetical protein
VRTFVIAEAVVLGIAKKLIDAAADSGVDAVKFQIFIFFPAGLWNRPWQELQKEFYYCSMASPE